MSPTCPGKDCSACAVGNAGDPRIPPPPTSKVFRIVAFSYSRLLCGVTLHPSLVQHPPRTSAALRSSVATVWRFSAGSILSEAGRFAPEP